MEEFSISGLEELAKDLERARKVYPDKVGETLIKLGKDFKKDVVKETKSAVDLNTGNLIKGYKVDNSNVYSKKGEVKFKSTAPHGHLIEYGHEQVVGGKKGKGGKTVGFVPGRLIIHSVNEKYGTIVPERGKQVIDEILGENNL